MSEEPSLLTLLAALNITRCAAVDLCPTDAELIAALRDRDYQLEFQLARQAKPPVVFVRLHRQGLRSISDVHCGRASPFERRATSCSLTAFYSNSVVVYETAKLAWRGGKWVVTDDLVVERDANEPNSPP